MSELRLIGAPERTDRFPVPGIVPDALADPIPALTGVALLLEPGESPHALGYRLYVAGIPVRIGRSAEFGGLSLTRRFAPDASDTELVDALMADTRP